jgi:cobalt-zinc-cadmium efflux system membrane fusion protein
MRLPTPPPWAPAITLLALGLMPLACSHRKADPKTEVFTRVDNRFVIPEGSPLRTRLSVQAARETEVRTSLTVPASIEADPSDLVKILPPVSGRVVQLHVHLGDWVQKGQPLVTLESADLAQAFADLQKAKAQFQLARKALDRVQELGRHDIASRKEVEQAEADFAGNESEWKRARAHVVQLGAAPDSATSHLLTVRAPIAGRVSELTAGTGGYWNDLNASLMTLANLAKVWFTASVQEKDIGSIFVGQEVEAALASQPGAAFHSKVAFVGEMLDPDTRTVKVRMVFDNASHRLLPSMFANVVFLQKPHRGLLVPTTALVQGQEGAKVFVEVAPWTFEARAVKAGIQAGPDTEILEGLKAGERLAGKEGVVFND